jgi:hypothetical protein
MAKELKRTDDPELDELIELVCRFGQAPSRDYLNVIKTVTTAKPDLCEETQSPPPYH